MELKLKIYLLSVEEGKILDSVNIDGKFKLQTYIDATREMSIILGDKNLKINLISFRTNKYFIY